jgi:hypothetical protein
MKSYIVALAFSIILISGSQLVLGQTYFYFWFPGESIHDTPVETIVTATVGHENEYA